jgi:hypothetical protein
MTILVVLISALALMAVVLAFVRGMGAKPREPERYPFESRAALTDREQVLYWRLRKALPDQIILAQVGLSRILRVQAGHNFRGWLDRINRMTIDFLVCRADATIVAAIELEELSTAPGDRAAVEETKAKALASAGIKLLRFRELPTEDEIRAALTS